MRHRCGKSHAYGRARLYDTLGLQIATDMLEHGEQGGVVGGKRALREGFAAKQRKTNVVVGACTDELHDHFFGSGHAVGTNVGRHHAGADVERHHDVDAFGLILV